MTLPMLSITERRPFADGHGFGWGGPHVRLVGHARFDFDLEGPSGDSVVHLRNAICDRSGSCWPRTLTSPWRWPGTGVGSVTSRARRQAGPKAGGFWPPVGHAR